MKKTFVIIICIFLTMLTSCRNRFDDNVIGNDPGIDTAETSESDTNAISNESKVESNGYSSSTNFVQKSGPEDYEMIMDELVYNGGEFNIYVELQFFGFGKEAEFVDALALFFVDGYIQEFSVDDDEKALVHKITIPNNTLSYINYKGELTTYNDSSDKHTICAVILPYWELGADNFIRDTALMAQKREIKLNSLNKPEENNILKMSTRGRTSWDSGHTELPYEHGESDADLTFHCFNVGETCCYVFCDGKLLSFDGKYIFESNNPDPQTVSFQNISVDSSEIGKPLFVLYMPKSYDSLGNRSCNYLWDRT